MRPPLASTLLATTLALAGLSATARAQDAPRAIAGAPFFAYVGERVELSAEWSTGPAPLTFDWEQVEGPQITLSDPAAERPRFVADRAGTYAFLVRVDGGGVTSEPARSLVHVVDPNTRADGGCATMAASPVGAPFALVLLVAARRRA